MSFIEQVKGDGVRKPLVVVEVEVIFLSMWTVYVMEVVLFKDKMAREALKNGKNASWVPGRGHLHLPMEPGCITCTKS